MDLNYLPDELIWETLLHASPRDLSRYLTINKRFRDIIENINFQEQYAKIHGPKFGYLETIETQTFRPDGTKTFEKIDIGEWDQGQKIGDHRQIVHEWFSNGQLKIEDNLINELLEGIQRRWYDNGQLNFDKNYVNGKFEGLIRTWFKNGQLRSEGNYVNGNPEGLIREWNDNGLLYKEENYINEQPEGIQRVWYSNGERWIEGNYINGKLEGLIRVWDDNGQITSKDYYVNGNLVKNPWYKRVLNYFTS